MNDLVNRDELRHRFAAIYRDASTAPRLFRAPGRVNLIGEHTDYNDGFVLPMAINCETRVAAAARTDRLIRAHTLNLDKSAEFNLDEAAATPEKGKWSNYVEGMARSLEARGVQLAGADLLIASDVPVGAGLSSSAALEISVGFALLSLAQVAIDPVQLALAGQAAEHEYTGTRSGIMDQFIVVRAAAGHALLIDCRTLEAKLVPLASDDDVVIAICDSEVKHSLASSEYNTRRAECERGVELLREFLPDIKALRDVSTSEFKLYEERLPEPVRRRCRHVITENERTLQAADKFRDGDMKLAGELMFASHNSLRDDYEVSCAELDELVEIASRIKGVYGARMTGGGFGGCTVNLVAREHLDDFRDTIKRGFAAVYNRQPPIYVSEAMNGAEEISA